MRFQSHSHTTWPSCERLAGFFVHLSCFALVGIVLHCSLVAGGSLWPLNRGPLSAPCGRWRVKERQTETRPERDQSSWDCGEGFRCEVTKQHGIVDCFPDFAIGNLRASLAPPFVKKLRAQIMYWNVNCALHQLRVRTHDGTTPMTFSAMSYDRNGRREKQSETFEPCLWCDIQVSSFQTERSALLCR